MAAQNFVLGNKTKLSIAVLDDAFLAAYNPAAPAGPATLTPLIGGTSADENISSNEVESTTFGDGLGYSNGLVTTQSWAISYNFNSLPNDAGFKLLSQAGANATETFCWVKKEDALPPGATTPRSIEGIVSVMNFSLQSPADGISTGTCELKGRGAPKITEAA